MAQGDTFTDGAAGSTAGNSTDSIDVTAAAGNHVVVHALGISHESFSSTGDSLIYSRDTGADTTWSANTEGGGSSTVGVLNWVGNLNTADGASTLTGAKIFIDDTVGLRVEFANGKCSSSSRGYAIHGQQVK